MYVALVGAIYCIQRSLEYVPDRNISEFSTYHLELTEERFLTTADGVLLQTWLHLPKKGKPMVLWFHGNAHHLGQRTPKFRNLIEQGYGFIAPSYRGYGKSEGFPTKEGLYSDARAAIRLLRDLGFKTENTLIIGESLGSGIATMMAVENQFKGVLLVSPYTSIANRAQEKYWYLPVRWMLKDNFDNVSKIDRIEAPVLIVHGGKDTVMPVHHAEELIHRAREPKKLVIYPSKEHSDLDFPSILKEMEVFFK